MTLLVVIIILALLFDYINGFHDAANSIATIVSTKVLTPFQAVLWAALFNFAAFFIFKDHGVANTIAKTVKESYITLQVVLAGLSAAIIWNLITWWCGGASIANAGFYAINMTPVLQIVVFIFLAPLLGMVMALIISLWFINAFRKSIWPKLFSIGLMMLTAFALSRMMEFDPNNLKSHYEHYVLKVIFHSHNFKLVLVGFILIIMCLFTLYLSRLNAHRSTIWFKRLQLVSSAAFSIGHGGNDAQKVMGIITVALISHGSIATFEEMPYWVPIACYTAIALGTLSGGWKIVKTMGSRITKVTPFEGVAAETAGAITLFVTEHLKIPVSTTHTIAGAIMGVGATKRLSAVRWGVTVNLLWAWIITIPVSALMAAAIYWLSHFFF